jgi:hypothetical protein
MTQATSQGHDVAELRQQLAAHEAVLASMATQLILTAADKHKMLEDVFTEALEQVDRMVARGPEQEAVKDRVHALADRVQHGE